MNKNLTALSSWKIYTRYDYFSHTRFRRLFPPWHNLDVNHIPYILEPVFLCSLIFSPSILVYYIFVLQTPTAPYPIFVPFVSLSYLSRALSHQLTTSPFAFACSAHTPIIGVDIWEHAFYLQYKNVKPDVSIFFFVPLLLISYSARTRHFSDFISLPHFHIVFLSSSDFISSRIATSLLMATLPARYITSMLILP